MKKTVKLSALICALIIIAALAACGEKNTGETSSQAADTSSAALADYGWVRFEMPAGYADTNESDYYVAVADENNDKHIIKIFNHTLVSGKTLEDEIADEMEYSQNPSIEDAFDVNGRSWTPAYFDFNSNRSVKLFTQPNDSTCCFLVVYEMTETDEAVQTVLSSIEFVPENI